MFCCFRCRLKDLIECSRWFWLPRKSRKRRENEIPNLTFRLIYIYILSRKIRRVFLVALAAVRKI